MKKIKQTTLPVVKDHVFHIPIEEIVPGDKLLIYDEHLQASNYWKVVTVPNNGIIITNFRNVLIEGEHTENLRIDWLPKFYHEYFGGLISFASYENENYIGSFSQGKFEDDFISHLFKTTETGTVMVLKNIEKLKSFFNKE